MKKIAIVAYSPYNCFMNAATRKRYGIVDSTAKVGEDGFSAPLPSLKLSYHGHRSRKSVVVNIHKAPMVAHKLVQQLGREDFVFLDVDTMKKLKCKPGCKVSVEVA